MRTTIRTLVLLGVAAMLPSAAWAEVAWLAPTSYMNPRVFRLNAEFAR
jgi:hypothetical protein